MCCVVPLDFFHRDCATAFKTDTHNNLEGTAELDSLCFGPRAK